MAGIIAQLPQGKSRFVPVDPELFEDAGDAADLVRIFLDHTVFESPAAELEDMEALEAQFEALSLCDYRVLYQGRDLELEKTAKAFTDALRSSKPCFVQVTWRLLGGKGGFGSLLKSQRGGKKTTNFDAMRDLNGRRVRHVKAVERIKEWLEKKKREDELVNLLTGEGPELPKATPKSESLDPEYLRKLKRSAASRSSLVSQGLQHLEKEQELEAVEEDAKRPKTEEKEEEEEDDGVDWMGAMSALNGLSSDEEASASKDAASSK